MEKQSWDTLIIHKAKSVSSLRSEPSSVCVSVCVCVCLYVCVCVCLCVHYMKRYQQVYTNRYEENEDSLYTLHIFVISSEHPSSFGHLHSKDTRVTEVFNTAQTTRGS